MALDASKNFSKSTLSSGISDVETFLEVAVGTGSRFPLPSTDGPFMAVIWDSMYVDPSDDPNVEIIQVTVRIGDSFDTIVRGRFGDIAFGCCGDRNQDY